MAVGLHRQRAIDLRRMNPHTSGARELQREQFRRGMREHEHNDIGSYAGDVQSLEIVQPRGERRWIVKSPKDGDLQIVVPSSGDATFSPGERVVAAQTRTGMVIISDSVSGDRGKALYPSTSVSEVGDLLEITSASPLQINVNEATVVTFTGRGFSSSPVDVLIPVVPDETEPNDDNLETDANWTIGVVTYVSSTEITATVTATVAGFLSVRPERG